MSKIRILIADDHALVRAGLRALLSAAPDFEVAGEAADGVVVVEQCRRLAPDLVLMDLAMPGRGGTGAIDDLRRTCENVKILVVSMQEDEIFVRQALLAGASGYVMKKSLASELTDAIRAVHRGERHLPMGLAAACEPQRAVASTRRSASTLESLSPREWDVITLVALGHTNLETAGRLHISDHTGNGQVRVRVEQGHALGQFGKVKVVWVPLHSGPAIAQFVRIGAVGLVL